ncbi:MAG: hypothetical protein U1E13_08275 [Methylophilaceae bacterium]|nr:hypothetical protein [Methylophilaceae bacterium]
MTRSLALGFVIYHPEESFLSRVQMAVESGFDVYVFDNSPDRRSLSDFVHHRGQIKYLTCGKNHGLGLGVSTICAQAYYEKHSALLLFDQDSVFDENTLSFIETFFNSHPELASTHAAVVFNSRRGSQGQGVDCFREVLLAINSGSLFFLNNVKTLNWHNEGYFVDGVDYEFCLRSKLNGFRISEYSCTPGFDHSTEQADRPYMFFGRIKAMRAYSPRRILDASISSIKLIFSALGGGAIKFSITILRLWILYLITQVLVRFLDLLEKRNNPK